MSVRIVLDLLPMEWTVQHVKALLWLYPGVKDVRLLAGADGRSTRSAIIDVIDDRHQEVLVSALNGLNVGGACIRASRVHVGDGVAA